MAIFWVAINQTHRIAISDTLDRVGLKISVRKFCVSDPLQNLEFLDVLHKASRESPFGVTTKNFIKATTKHRTFVHGQSHHPKLVYKSIVLSESMRLRRLCEESSDCFEGHDQLACKCGRSHFSKKLYFSIISNAKTWTDRFNRVVWSVC